MDPLSIAASVAGLVALVGKLAEVSRELYTSVQKKPQLLARLANELDTFYLVLVELRCHLRDDGVSDQDALKAVSVSCDETMKKLGQQLNSLREMFTKRRLTRLLSRSRFLELMSDIEAATGCLYAYKQSLTIALQLRVLKKQSADYFRMEETLDTLTEACQQLKGLKLPGPVEQYISISETMIEQKRNVSLWSITGFQSQPVEAAGDGMSSGETENDDVDKIRSFGSFEDWLNSFTPSPAASVTSGVEDVADVSHSNGTGKPLSSRSTVRVRVRTPAEERITKDGNSAAELDEMIELKMTDYVHKAIDVLHQRGFKNVRGFRSNGQMLAPLAPIDEPIAVHVTDGPSSYSLGWLAINLHERFDEFYDSVIRHARNEKESLNFSVEASGDGSLFVRDVHHNITTKISFGRTLRVPEDGTKYHPPAPLSNFPVVNINHLQGKLPGSVTQKTGVVIPMYPREAMVLSFWSYSDASNQYHRMPFGTQQNLAIKVLTGGINAISGLPARDGVILNRQDYIIVPLQNRLDGFLAASKDERGMVRQFVSMPTGEGYAIEGQVTGEEKYGGLQLLLAPPFIGPCTFWLDKHRGRHAVRINCLDESPSSMGFTAGMRLRMSGKNLTEVLRIRQNKALDKLNSQSWSAPGTSFEQNTSRGSLCGIRPLSTHEVLQPFLGRFEPIYPLVLEPVFDISITIKVENQRRPHLEAQESYTWSLSPFMTEKRLREIILREVVPLRYAKRLELLHPARNPHAQRPVMLHDFAQDGDVIAVSELGPLEMLSNGARIGDELDVKLPLPSPSPLPTKASGWELGFGFGGWIYQDCLADNDKSQWNWKKSRLLNVLMLNAVAFKSFTGFAPPKLPISFHDYVAHGIPFHHVLPRSSVVGSEIISRLDSVSETDTRKGVIRSNVLHGLKPVQCALCEKMLANTMSGNNFSYTRLCTPLTLTSGRIRPCNHVYCSNCVRQNLDCGESIQCAACARPSTHQIQFAGPMETPLETELHFRNRNERHSKAAFSTQKRRMLSCSNTSISRENATFVSAIRRAAMLNIIDDISMSLGDTSPLNGDTTRGNESFTESSESVAAKWDNDFERTMLQAAAEQGRVEVVQFLLQSCQPSPADQLMALRIAVDAGKLDIVNALARRVLEHEIQAEAEKAKEQARSGVQRLIRPSPRAELCTGEILHLAAERGHCEVVQLLLGLGFDANQQVYDFAAARYCPSALAQAAKKNRLATAKVLFPATKACLLSNAAMYAATNDGHDVLEFLLEQGLDVNDCGDADKITEWTLLHSAADARCPEAGKSIEILLRYGADIASTCQNSSRLFWFRELGGPPPMKMSPVQRSIDKGNFSAFEALLSAGADVHTTLDDGRTCLHLAARGGCVKIGSRLLEMGFDPNVRAEKHHTPTPLRTAIMECHPDFARLLVARGAVVENVDKLKTIDRLTHPTSITSPGWWEDFDHESWLVEGLRTCRGDTTRLKVAGRLPCGFRNNSSEKRRFKYSRKAAE